MDSGDDSSSSDDFGSDTRHEASSATTSTCAISPGVSSSNKGMIKSTITNSKDTGGFVAAALNAHEQRDSSWLDIDHFLNSDLEVEDRAAEGKYQEMGNIADKSGSNGAKDSQAQDGSQEVDHNDNGAGDRPGDEDGVEHGEDDVIMDPVMDGIEVNNGNGPQIKDGHSLGVCGNGEGWCHPHASLVSELTLQFQESRTLPISKPFRLQCPLPLLVWPAEVGVGLAAADLQLQ